MGYAIISDQPFITTKDLSVKKNYLQKLGLEESFLILIGSISKRILPQERFSLKLKKSRNSWKRYV